MAPVECPDCGNAVSAEARACPHCGRPMRPTTIERTGAKWNAVMVCSAVVAVIGGCGFMAGWDVARSMFGAGDTYSTIGVILVIAGLAGLLIGAVGAWREHG